jgi:hypothetical protein
MMIAHTVSKSFAATLTTALATAAALGSAAAAPETGVYAQPPEPVEHVVHVDLTTLALANGISINYEHMLHENLALRIGYSASAVWMLTDSKSAHGPLAALSAMFGDDHKLELTAGFAVVDAGGREPPIAEEIGDGWYVSPVAFVGYRHQPEAGGLVKRVGLGMTGGYGAFLTLGVGAAF